MSAGIKGLLRRISMNLKHNVVSHYIEPAQGQQRNRRYKMRERLSSKKHSSKNQALIPRCKEACYLKDRQSAH
jgi:hypothetical protein